MPRVAVLCAAVLFGTTGAAQALGPAATSPLTVGALRILLGGGILATAAWLTGSLRGAWPLRLVALAGAGVAVYQLAFFQAVADTGVAVGAVVAIGSGPVFTGVFEHRLGGRPAGRWLAATSLALLGVVVLTLSSTTDTAMSPVGIGLALVAGAGYAAYTVVAKRLLALGRAPIGVMGTSFGTGAALLLPFLLVGDVAWVGTRDGLALALYLGVVPTAIAYVLFAHGLQRLEASEVSTLVLAEPLTATAVGLLVLDESIGSGGLLGAALVLSALAVLAVPRRQRRPEPVGVPS